MELRLTPHPYSCACLCCKNFPRHWYFFFVDGKKVGRLRLREDNDRPHPLQRSCHIAGVLIFPKQRGKGYGELMMKLAIDKAKNMGYKRIQLEVEDNNSIAKSLYLKLRFHFIPGQEGWAIKMMSFLL